MRLFDCGYAVWFQRLNLLVLTLGAMALPAQTPPSGQVEAKSVPVIMLSDLHLDPFTDPAKFARLRTAGVRDWDAIFAAPPSATLAADAAKLIATCPMRGVDSTPALAQASLHAAHEAAPRAAFVTVSGDLLAHNFDCRFKALAGASTDEDYSAFAAKTALYVARKLRAAFGRTPVYIGLGNNDSGCGDYRESNGSAFLRALAASIAGEAAPSRGSAAFARTFAKDGSYSVRLPKPFVRGRLIVLQDMFESRMYKSCNGRVDAAAGAAQMAWLGAQLGHARAAHEQVWVMAHIPPGVDVYSTVRARGNVCAGVTPVMFLDSEELVRLLTDYGDIVRLALFGHTHNDEIHLLQPESGRPGTAAVPMKLVPSVSPINGNQPAFTVAEVDTGTVTLEDYRVLMADNVTGIATKWSEEYRFSTLYGFRGYTAANVGKLVDGFVADHGGLQQRSADYQQNFYPGGGKGSLAVHLVWPQYACATANHTVESYTQCACSAPAAAK